MEQIAYKTKHKKMYVTWIKKYKAMVQMTSAAATALAVSFMNKTIIISKKPTKTCPKTQLKI